MSDRTKPYTVTELAKDAGLSVAYVRRLVADGKIVGTMYGKTWLIPADVGRAWLASRRSRGKKSRQYRAISPDPYTHSA